MAAVDALPWVADGLTDTEVTRAQHLRDLTGISLDVFWKVMDHSGFDIAGDNPDWHLPVQYLLLLASLEEAATLAILDMNFLSSPDSSASASLRYLLDLAYRDRDGFHSLLASQELSALTESGKYEAVPLLHLQTQDPESAAAIEALSWVQDGILDLDMWSVAYLAELALQSKDVFHAVLAKKRLWLPPDYWIEAGSLMYLVSISAIDEWAALQILEMRFFRSIDLADYSAMKTLADLAASDPVYLREFLSLPFLHEYGDYNFEVAFSLLQLRHTSIEAAESIQALPWFRDGISRPYSTGPIDRQSTTAFEFATASNLLDLAGRSPDLMMSLVANEWMYASTNYLKWRIVSNVDELASRDLETALRVVRMPFLNNLQEDDEDTLRMMNILGTSGWEDMSNQEGLRNMLNHQDFINLAVDEQADEISGPIARITIDARHPEEAAVINAFPWVQDGINASESTAIRQLATFVLRDPGVYYSDEVVNVLIHKPWVRDGLTEDEVSAISWLMILTEKDESITISLLDMPFLESVDDVDASALATLAVISSQLGLDVMEQVVYHPSLDGGITDPDAAIIDESYRLLEESLENLDTLFDPQDN